MRKFDDMKMPGYYSEMDDSEKGLAIGSGEDCLGYALMGSGGVIGILGGLMLPPGAAGKDAYVQKAAQEYEQGLFGHPKYSPGAAKYKAECDYNENRTRGKSVIGLGVLMFAAGAAVSIVNACKDDD